MRRYSTRYEAVGQVATPERPRSEISAGASYGVRSLGNFSLDWRRTQQYDGADRRVVSVGYSRNLSGSISLLASASRSWGDLVEPADNHVFIAVTFNPSRDLSASLFHDQRGDASSDLLQIGNNTPIGEGLGYRLVGERSDEGFGDAYRVAPSLLYNGPHGVYTLDLRADRPATGPAQTSYQLGAGGGIALVGGTLSFSRPVTDSFGLVDVGELEGVRVYQSAEQVGRTDAHGRVFLPNLGSYVANRIAIDDRDVPVEYRIDNKELNISPGLRSGALIRFAVTRVQAFTGRLVVDVHGKLQPAEYLDLTVTVDGKDLASPTGRDGEFYLENLPPGRHAARFMLGARECRFDLTVPATQDMLVELGVVHACQFDP
jgi:outer membrane usher protein FimD/PapC